MQYYSPVKYYSPVQYYSPVHYYNTVQYYSAGQYCSTIQYYSKGKSVPLQAWSGPEGSKKLRFPDFMTTAQGGGKVVTPTHRPHLRPGNSPGNRFC